MVIPQRFPHPSGADLGDNYISGLSDNSALQREFDDRFMSNGPGANNNHSPSILRPFTGRFDTDLKQDFWTPHKQEHFRNPLIRRLDSNFCNHPRDLSRPRAWRERARKGKHMQSSCTDMSLTATEDKPPTNHARWHGYEPL